MCKQKGIKELKTLAYISMVLLWVGCTPEKIEIELTSSQIQRALHGELVEVPFSAVSEVKLSISDIREQVSTNVWEKGQPIPDVSQDDKLLAFGSSYMERSCKLLTALLNGAGVVATDMKTDGTNVLMRITVTGHAALGLDATLKTNECRNALMIVNVRDRDAEKNVLVLDLNPYQHRRISKLRALFQAIEQSDNLGYTFADMTALLNPIVYLSTVFSFKADSQVAVAVKTWTSSSLPTCTMLKMGKTFHVMSGIVGPVWKISVQLMGDGQKGMAE